MDVPSPADDEAITPSPSRSLSRPDDHDLTIDPAMLSSFEVIAAPEINDSIIVDTERFPLLTEAHLRIPRKRRVMLPVVLFLITCASTFWTGATSWEPIRINTLTNELDCMAARRAVIRDWDQGLIYMGSVLSILLAHEMGHFLTSMRYRIAASLPYFIPVPIFPIGTMGAVIGMDGLRANRRQLFDIGLAGPLAGLVIAIPLMWIGVEKLDLEQPGTGAWSLNSPILVNWMLEQIQPDGFESGSAIWSRHQIAIGQVNPYFMAGWIGLLITGLNMLPISQLDGGHLIYTLFGRRAHWIARIFLFAAIAFILLGGATIWLLMLLIVVFIGTDHPPTSNDQMTLGRVRTSLGLFSLLIPVLCFPPYGITPL